MKRWAILTILIVGAGAALFYSERHNQDAPVTPSALLNAVADTQREISRVPMKITRLSDDEEVRIGNGIAQSELGNLHSRYSFSPTDAAFEKYVQWVGRTVSSRATRKLDYKFYYVPDPNFFNAFALPGGHIVIGKGLVLQMTTEDELAAVLGHEVEHVDRYHCAERVQVEARLKNLPFSGLVNLPITLFQAGYSKEQELEADRAGTQLAVTSGYSPQGALHMFEMLQKLDRQYLRRAETPSGEVAQGALETLGGYFRSHPLPSERIQQINDLIKHEHWPLKPERNLQFSPK